MFETVGVVGAGQMGHGIAQVCSQAGSAVIMLGQTEDVLEDAVQRIKRSLEKLTQKNRLKPGDTEKILARLKVTTSYEDMAPCEVIFEAVSENENLKRTVFKKLVPHLSDSALIASNTSSISITRLGTSTDRPEKFCGVHFMNPVPAMQLVELIRGLATDEHTFNAFKAYVEGPLAKTTSISEDFPGFIVNRILMPMINEAIYVLYEGVGSVSDIDTGMKLGTRHPLGPLELADFIGLDTVLSILHVLHGDLADQKYRPCPLLMKYIEAGWLGQKSGRGFYDYSTDPPRPTR